MKFNVVDWIAFALVVIGAINWGLVGLFGLNLVTLILGELTFLASLVFVLVGISGLWMLYKVTMLSKST